MKIRDYLFLTWLFGNKKRHERMIEGPNGGYLCNACRTVVDPQARLCRGCGSDLYTAKGKLLRGLTAFFALGFILFGLNPTTNIVYFFIGLGILAVSGYYEFNRPVH